MAATLRTDGSADRNRVVHCAEGFAYQQDLAACAHSLLHSIHLGDRSIWISLVGETNHETRGILGGDSGLSRDGLAYLQHQRWGAVVRTGNCYVCGDRNRRCAVVDDH